MSNAHNAFTLRVFFPDGDPNGLRVIDDNNWTGRALCISRDAVHDTSNFAKTEFTDQQGVYLLIGDIDKNADDSEFSHKIYIGQTDNLPKRLQQHSDKTKGKDFWHFAIAFSSTKGALSRGHCQWLENKLIAKAKTENRCILDNADNGSEAKLTNSDEADCAFFLNKIYQILPLVGIQAFEAKEANKLPELAPITAPNFEAQSDTSTIPDTVVVPAREDGFQRVFLGENSWYSIRISKDRIPDLKYIAGYRVGKTRAVTHWARIKEIVPYGDEGKYKINFDGAASALQNPIAFASGVDSSLQASRYTKFSKLEAAQNLSELFDLSNE